MHIPILDSTLAKLTEEEKANLQQALDSYWVRGYDEGYANSSEESYDRGYDAAVADAEDAD